MLVAAKVLQLTATAANSFKTQDVCVRAAFGQTLTQKAQRSAGIREEIEPTWLLLDTTDGWTVTFPSA